MRYQMKKGGILEKEDYMEELLLFLNKIIDRDFLSAVLSNPRNKDGVRKVKARPVRLRGGVVMQLERFTEKQAFHENVEFDKAAQRMCELMEEFRQMQVETRRITASILVSRKGKVTIKKKQQMNACIEADLSHDRAKKYILEEGRYVPYLEDLGVMTGNGKIIRGRMDKFRQVNRFLEFIEDVLPELPRDREITILDFGCGKSYLTFAMYDYLHEIKGYDIRIIGLDLKKEVIRDCQKLAEKYSYEKLHFLEGDIADYEGVDAVDMVVTLHACDTATDFALAKAVGWNARVILSVPCCQHELNRQMNENPQEFLRPMMKYGLIQERIAALLTDALRAERLWEHGYETQILEFIDMEHTPKNILIRAVKRSTARNAVADKELSEKLSEIQSFFHIDPLLGRLLNGSGQ